MAYIEVKNCSKYYQIGENQVTANDKVTFEIEKGELVVILGASGAGKSTVLNILGGMDTSDRGQVIVDHQIISDYSRQQLTAYRRNDIGFVFQFYNLVPNLTAKENVELAVEIVNDALDPETVLSEVGLSHRLDHFPSQLSGGEQQRVSIARALAKKPKILLCDEPTGALDYKTGKQILNLLKEMAVKKKTTVVIVTHNSALAPMADRVIHLQDAKVTTVSINDNPIPIDQIEY
ncbi:ABC transporter ATP-binding protein [Streptococcus hongkongensis]